MTAKPAFLAKLERRNTLDAAALQIGSRCWRNVYFDQVTESPTPSHLNSRLLDAALVHTR